MTTAAATAQKSITFSVKSSYYDTVKSSTKLTKQVVNLVCQYSDFAHQLLHIEKATAYQVNLPGKKVKFLQQQEGQVYFLSEDVNKFSLLILSLLAGGKITQLDYNSPIDKRNLIPGMMNDAIARNGDTLYGLTRVSNHATKGLSLNRWRIQGNQVTFHSQSVVNPDSQYKSDLVLNFDSLSSVLIFGADMKIFFAYDGAQSVVSDKTSLVADALLPNSSDNRRITGRLAAIRSYGEYEMRLSDLSEEELERIPMYPYSCDWIPFMNKKQFPENATACEGNFWGSHLQPRTLWNKIRSTGSPLVIEQYDANNTPIVTLTSNERINGTVGSIFPSTSSVLFEFYQEGESAPTYYYLGF